MNENLDISKMMLLGVQDTQIIPQVKTSVQRWQNRTLPLLEELETYVENAIYELDTNATITTFQTALQQLADMSTIAKALVERFGLILQVPSQILPSSIPNVPSKGRTPLKLGLQ